MNNETKKQYTGYGYHGGGRKKLPADQKKIFKTISISGSPEEVTKLKIMAKDANKTVSRFIFDNLN